MEREAAALSIVKAVSTIGAGGTNDIWVDLLKVPQGWYAVIYGISIRVPIGSVIPAPGPTVFICDQTYNFDSSPLDANGQFDSSQGGCAITGSDLTMPSSKNIATSWLNSGQVSSNGAPLFVLPQKWFLRTATQTGTSGGVTAGSQYEISVLYSLLPLCEN